MSQNQNEDKKGLDRFNKQISFSNDGEFEDKENFESNDEQKHLSEYDVDDTDKKDEIKQDTQDKNDKNDKNIDNNENDNIDNKTQKQDIEKENKQEDKVLDNETVSENTVKTVNEEIKEELKTTQESTEKEIKEEESIERINEIIAETVSSKEDDSIYKEPKFVIDIDDDDYNVSDFNNEYNENDTQNLEDYQENQDKSFKKQKKKTTPLGMFFRIILAFIFIGVLAFGAIAGVYAYGDFSGITGNGISVKVDIPPNTSVSEVGDILKENGIIKYPPIFKAYIKYIYKQDVVLHYGKYNLNSSMGYEALLETLQNPAESESGIKITIKEGQTVSDIANLLEENHICTAQDFLNAVANGTYDYPFVNEIQNPQERVFRLEGYLFPDTYQFKQGTPAEDVVKTLLSTFDSKFTDQMRYAIEISPYSFDEIITLASIIQAEAPTKTDMMKVSSVYRNRLENPTEYPKLQADPTSKYANRVLLPSGASEETASKYDTYKKDGLPIGPINNPGLEAILSAIYPATTNYYYFCTDLTSKQFYYADTYELHQQNLELAGLTEE